MCSIGRSRGLAFLPLAPTIAPRHDNTGGRARPLGSLADVARFDQNAACAEMHRYLRAVQG